MNWPSPSTGTPLAKVPIGALTADHYNQALTKKPAREQPWTTNTWFYDLRTNQHFTLKRHKLTIADLQPFIDAYRPDDLDARGESERSKAYSYDQLVNRDQVNLDISWLRDDSHLDADDLPDPDILVNEILEDLRTALTEFEELADELEQAG